MVGQGTNELTLFRKPRVENSPLQDLQVRKDYIIGRLKNHNLPVTELFKEIKDRGYRGGISILRKLIRSIKEAKIQQSTTVYQIRRSG